MRESQTLNWKAIMLQYDITSPKVYLRFQPISETKGISRKYPLPGRISKGSDEWLNEEEMKVLTEKYTHEIVKRIGDLAKEIGGHGEWSF